MGKTYVQFDDKVHIVERGTTPPPPIKKSSPYFRKTQSPCIVQNVLLICLTALAKFNSTRGASHHPALLGNCQFLVAGVSPNRSKATSLETQNLVTL